MIRALPPACRPHARYRNCSPETSTFLESEDLGSSARRLLTVGLTAFALIFSTGPSLDAQTGGSSTQEPTQEEAAPAEPEEPRATFDVALGTARGGGRVIGSAGDYELQPGRAVIATGGVVIKYKDLTLEADRLRLDIPSNRVTAEGNVVLDEGPERLSGDVLEYDLDNRTGHITQAKAEVQPGYFFSGDEIRKIGQQQYTVQDGIFTSCDQEVPSWSLAMSKASITIEEYARIKNARLRFKKLPVLYVPYLVWPATTERASGFLIPKPGYSDRLGAHVSMAYFKTLGRSADMTFFGDVSTEEYYGLGMQFRYRPSDDTSGVLDTYFRIEPDEFDRPQFRDEPTFDPDFTRGDDRWKIVWGHETDNLWDRFRGVVNLQLYSDFDYLRDVERVFDRRSQPYVYSNAFLSRNWGQHSFNFMVDQRELVNNNRTRNTRRQLPEIEYKLRPTRLGSTSIYFGLESSANFFSVDFESPPPADPTQERDKTTIEYGRFDIAPSVQIPLSTLPWLSAKATVGARVTQYTKSLPEEDPDGLTDPIIEDEDPLSGGSLTRDFPFATVEVVGPSFLRIFDGSGKRFSKYKHIVEPRIKYFWVSDSWDDPDIFDEGDRISVFDEIDTLRPANAARVSLFNRLVAKSAPKRSEDGEESEEDEDVGGAFEIASLEIRQDFNFNDLPGQTSINGRASDKGPIVSVLRINPTEDTSFKLDLEYSTLQSELSALSLSGGVKLGEQAIGLTWFTRWSERFVPDSMAGIDGFRPTFFEESSDQIRFFGKFQLLPDRLFFDAEFTYNLLDPVANSVDGTVPSRFLNQRYALDYRSQCYSWVLEFRENQYTLFKDSELRFSLSLRNVGTFLDLSESF